MGLSTQKQVGLDRPGSDGVHSNAARSELFCYNTNNAFDGALRSVVDAVAGSVEGTRGTAEADQSAAVPHLARSLAQGIECAAPVDMKVSVKIKLGRATCGERVCQYV